MGKLQKLKQAMQLQTDFRNGAAKYLNAEQVKKQIADVEKFIPAPEAAAKQ